MMRKFLIPFFFISSILFADDCCCPPFSFSGIYLTTNGASFEEESLDGQKLYYEEANLSFTYTHALAICPDNSSYGFRLGAGYTNNTIDWKENPDFNQTSFNYIDFLLGFYLKQDEWLLSLNGFAYFDPNVVDLNDYALYQVIMHGRYTCSDSFHFNAGFILELGLSQNMIWPILGFEWDINDSWSLDLVYPLDLSLEYQFLDNLSFSASARFLRTRHRVMDSEPNPRAIFEYKNWGIEADVIYHPVKIICLRGFAGSALGGDFKIANEKYEHATHYKLDSALYAGVSGNIFF